MLEVKLGKINKVKFGSGGYEDYHYRCIRCNADWWIEGGAA